MSGNWGIKADDGYVNFIQGTVDEVWDFETSSNIDDVCIFGEMVAKGHAQALNATAFRINISEQPQLTIPQSIADGLDEEIDDGYKNLIDVFQRGWFISEAVEDWYYGKERELVIVDPQKSILIVAYLLGKALGVDLVKVVEG